MTMPKKGRLTFRGSLLAFTMVALGQHAAIAAETLKGPWDDSRPASSHAGSATPCAAAPALPVDLQTADYYNDAAHSKIDPARKLAYDRATEPLHMAARGVDAMADRYQASGDVSAAVCAASWLETFSQARVLTGSMTSNQAIYVQGWMLGSFAIAWLKIRSETAVPASMRSHISSWLAEIASQNLRYYTSRGTKTDGHNNHRYWAGLAVMAAGIADNRRDLYDWGVDSFQIAITQVSAEGTLPLEMVRRSRALHYHLFAAAPLVTMAEFAEANGTDLYGENDKALARLIHRAASGIDNPSFFAAKAGIAQEPVHLHAEDIAWAAPFAQRFPDPLLNRLLSELPSHSMLYIGGLPAP
jgi:poly(beta-D-mannuronate) lyase